MNFAWRRWPVLALGLAIAFLHSQSVSAQPAPATLVYPTNGSLDAVWSRPFQWTSVPGAQAYYLYVGSTPGAKDVVDSGELQATSYLNTRLPLGRTFYARLWTKIGGVWWPSDSSFGSFVATLLTPVDGIDTADLSQNFYWTGVPGAQAYSLKLGTVPGGNDLLDTGELPGTFYLPTNLPTATTIHARLGTEYGGVWRYVDSSFSSFAAHLITPVDGTLTADFTPTFQWTSIAGAQAYYLYVGTAPGAKDVIDSGELQATSFLPRVPPPVGRQLSARLWTRVAGVWRHTDTTFGVFASSLTTPVNGTLTANLTQPLVWPTIGAQAYYLYLGTTKGAKDLVDSGELHTNSYTPTNLPTGRLIYARLWTKYLDGWIYTDSTFGSYTARLATPPGGTTTADYTQPFQWTSVTGAQAYYLYVGTSVGAKNLIDTGELQTTSYLPRVSLPLGQTLYARLSTKVDGVWRFTDSTFASYLATLATPPHGTLTADFTQPFQWTSVVGAQAYYLYVGTTLGAKNLIDTGELQATSYTPHVALPLGQTLYARLFTKLAGTWRFTDSTFGSYVATLTAPVNGTMTANFAQPFQWTTVPGAQAYYLYLGTTPGAKNVIDSGELHATSYTPHVSLPLGQTLYARLWTETGGVWRATDSSFGSYIASLTTPANGTLTANFAQPFQWGSVPGAQAYYLYVGTSAGAKNLIDSGELQGTSYTPKVSLPLGQVLYARLWTEIGGIWRPNDSVFGSYVATLTTPANGTLTANFTQPFQWTGVAGAQAYYLYVGTSAGAKNLIDSGELQGTSYTPKVSLPLGQLLYARLSTKVDGVWRYNDTTFGSYVATLTTPVNGTLAANLSQPFQWTSVAGAQAYYLYVGTTPGAKNLIDTGETHTTSYLPRVSLPLRQTLYARLWTKIGDVWRSTDSSFGDFLARFTYPINGSQSVDLSRPFQWTSVSNAQAYYVYVGSTPGAKDLLNTGELHQTSIATHLSTNQTLYVRLWTELNGVWLGVDYVFRSISSVLTYPADGARAVDPAHPFQWSATPGAEAYRLLLGRTQGASDLLDTGETSATSWLVPTLPAGPTIYARLQTRVAGEWRQVDSTFIALPAGPLVHPGDFVYQGSFRVPFFSALHVPNTDRGFDYGGSAPAYNPLNNTLFLVSHVYDQLTAELSIPPVLGTGPVRDWPVATVVTPFTDTLEGQRLVVAAGEGDTTTIIGGNLVYNNELYVTPYLYYGDDTASHSHWRRSPALTAVGTLQGPYAVGPLGPDFYTGYMGLVPQSWQAPFGGPVLNGQCCLSLVNRTSYGPSVSALDPSQLGDTTLVASTLVAYPNSHKTLGDWGTPGVNAFFNGTTQIKSVVFPEGTSSVLFFGRQGLGPYCYGDASTGCVDPEDGNKGDHAYPYAYYIWAYDAHDLAAVKAGEKQPWDVVPYAVWPITFPSESRVHRLGGVTYDPATGRLFISQQFVDGDSGNYPVIHVYTVQP